MRNLFYFIVVILIGLLMINCEKNTDPITAYFDNDTTDHGDMVVKKPNIYVYPNEKMTLDIQINFPHGGEIIESIPEYNSGWEIEVIPSGLINNHFRYLFYEARIPALLQKEFGWEVEGAHLSSFFQGNMKALLFSPQEIDDFIDYWIPLLDMSKSYVIYPSFNEDLEDVIELGFSVEPDNLIRVFYIIEEQQSDKPIEPPQLPLFKREGFVVLEWGVIN